MAEAQAGSNQDPTGRILGLVAGFGIFQALHVAAALGIADAIGEGACPAEAVAAQVGAEPQVLYRLLRALVSVGVFAEDAPGSFRNTPASALLRRDAPGSLRSFALLTGSKECWDAWSELGHSVRTGQPSFDHIFGMPLFEYLAQNSGTARIFDEAMAARSAAEIKALLGAYDFSGAGHVVDVGGGNGALLAAILDRYPQLEGTVFDLPHVVDPARQSHGRQPRLHFAGGSFFTDVPVRGDTYILKKVIHDWPDERARQILERCRAAMAPGARLLLIESVVPPGTPPTFLAFLDLWMLVFAGGRERTEREFRSLLQSAGLSLIKVVPTPSPVCVIEAAPA
jgi:hypothetical protein